MKKLISIISAIILLNASIPMDGFALRPAAYRCTSAPSVMKVVCIKGVVKVEGFHGLSACNIDFFTVDSSQLENLPFSVFFSVTNLGKEPTTSRDVFNIAGLLRHGDQLIAGSEIIIFVESETLREDILQDVAEHIAYVISTYYEVDRQPPQKCIKQLSNKYKEWCEKLRSKGLDLRKFDPCDKRLREPKASSAGSSDSIKDAMARIARRAYDRDPYTYFKRHWGIPDLGNDSRPLADINPDMAGIVTMIESASYNGVTLIVFDSKDAIYRSQMPHLKISLELGQGESEKIILKVVKNIPQDHILWKALPLLRQKVDEFSLRLSIPVEDRIKPIRSKNVGLDTSSEPSELAEIPPASAIKFIPVGGAIASAA